MNDSIRKYSAKVGVLGATGAVGQRFISLLEHHPWFHVKALGASIKNIGKRYSKVVHWKLSTPLPTCCRDLELVECCPKNFFNCDIIFSGLNATVAGEIESEFAQAGFPVFSNAKNHRLDDHVPILIPLINSDHIKIIENQETFCTSKGFIITNANCCSTGIAIALAPLHKAFEITDVFVATLQAVSGAGYPGVASMDIIGNVIPYISNEEEKIQTELNKILGTRILHSLNNSRMRISAMCHRVPVMDGHTISISVKLRSKKKDVLNEALRAWNNWEISEDIKTLPSCPEKTIIITTGEDHPQPRLHCTEQFGMTTFIGRIQLCPVFDLKFTCLSHNTILGAAGGSILNAELALIKGYIKLSQHV